MLDRNISNDLKSQIKRIAADRNEIKELFNISSRDADLELNDYEQNMKLAATNAPHAREYVIDYYSKLLNYLGYYKVEVMSKLIDFDHLLRNNDYVLFEMLMKVREFSEYLDIYKIGVEEDEVDDGSVLSMEELLINDKEVTADTNYSENFNSAKLREIVQTEQQNIDDYFIDSSNRVNLLATIIYADVWGSSVIDSLTYQLVTEVAFSEKDYIYVIYKSVKIWLSFLRFSHVHVMEAIQKKGSGLSKESFEEKTPYVITSKSNGSRVTAVGYSATPGFEARYYNERIFRLKKMTLENMLNLYNTIDENIYKFMTINQWGRGSYLVSGADMGVGKSTMLIAILAKTPLKWGLGILDPQNEMQVKKKFPQVNSKTIVPGPHLSIGKGFEILLKQARDVLCVSEIAGYEEMSELIKAGTRLNSGVSGTLHSLSDEEVVPNCTELLMETGKYDTRESAELAVAKAVNLVYHMAVLPGGRIVVDYISEIVPMPRDVYVGDLKIGDEYSLEEKQERALELEQMYYSKLLYSKPYRLNRLIQFNRKTGGWDVVGKPTQHYYDRVGIRLGSKAIRTLDSIFSEVS